MANHCRLLGTYLPIAISVAASLPCRGGDRVEEIIANIRANELLYENLEFRFEYLGQVVISPTVYPMDNDDITRLEYDSHFVYQNGLLLYRGTRHETTPNRTLHRSVLLGYDGEATRAVQDDVVANVRKGRFEGRELLSPHTLVLFDSFSRSISMSEYLTLRDFHSVRNFRITNVEFEGEESVDGVPCFRLRYEYMDRAWGDGPADTGYLWIAPEFNYIPVKKDYYAANYGNGVPIATVTLSDFREIEPGIWFPFKVSEIVNYEMAIREGKAVELRRVEGRVTEAKLDPNYPREFFQVAIPAGATVHYIEDDELVESRVEGAPRPGVRRAWLWWLMALLVVAGLAGAYLRYGRRQTSSTIFGK